MAGEDHPSNRILAGAWSDSFSPVPPPLLWLLIFGVPRLARVAAIGANSFSVVHDLHPASNIPFYRVSFLSEIRFP